MRKLSQTFHDYRLLAVEVVERSQKLSNLPICNNLSEQYIISL